MKEASQPVRPPDWLARRYHSLAIVENGAPPRPRDYMLATALATLGFLELLLTDFPWPIARAVTMVIAIAVLPFRRPALLWATPLAFLVQFVLEVIALNKGLELETPAAHLFAGFILVYSISRWLPPRRAALGFALAVGLVASTEFAGDETLGEKMLFLLLWAIPALFALAMRYRSRLAAEQSRSIRLADRNALARELHDAVAHHVSAIAVQAQAARFVAASDPNAALANIANIETIANTTIEEMRRMVGILRNDFDRPHTVRTTNFRALNDSGAAPPATIIGEASLEHLPSSIAGAVYSVVQESVTNARRHNTELTFISVDMHTGLRQEK